MPEPLFTHSSQTQPTFTENHVLPQPRVDSQPLVQAIEAPVQAQIEACESEVAAGLSGADWLSRGSFEHRSEEHGRRETERQENNRQSSPTPLSRGPLIDLPYPKFPSPSIQQAENTKYEQREDGEMPAGAHNDYGDDSFMNPGPAPRPPTDKPRLGLMPSTAGIPGNMSQPNLSSKDYGPGYNDHGPTKYSAAAMYAPHSLSRSTTMTTVSSPSVATGGVTIIKQGYAKVKESIMYKQRYLILRSYELAFHKSKDGKVTLKIPLKEVINVTRSENVKLGLEIARVANPTPNMPASSIRDAPQKVLIVQFENDDDLYQWSDAINDKCPGLGGVSNPTDFTHRVHVGFDPNDGAYFCPSSTMQPERD